MHTAAERPLDGKNRIEHWEVLSRPFRMGSSTQLGISDVEYIRSLLEQTADKEATLQSLDYIHQLYIFMVSGGLEWSLRWRSTVAQKFDNDQAARITQAAVQAWREMIFSKPENSEETVSELLSAIFVDRVYAHQVSVEKNLSLLNELVGRVVAEPVCTLALVRDSGTHGLFEQAVRQFDAYVEQMRLRHDLLIKFLWSYATVVNDQLGQPAVEDGLKQTFQGCSFNEAMWGLFGNLNPAELTAVLAEHMRIHFSGALRDGGVEIIEEKDRFRLVFSPCGSGGAMRLASKAAGNVKSSVLTDASGSTWGRANEVSAYCAHCAQNELASFKRFGFPKWVTEFDPDPTKPCGWSVFKDPNMIPEQYFKRLGVERQRAKVSETK